MYFYLKFIIDSWIKSNSITDYAQTFGEIWKIQLKIIKVSVADVTVNFTCVQKR